MGKWMCVVEVEDKEVRGVKGWRRVQK